MRPFLVKTGVSSTNAVSTLVQLLKGCVVSAPKASAASGGSNAAAGAAGMMAAAGSPADLCRAEIKVINDEEKPEFADTAEWVRDKSRRVMAVRLKYGGPSAEVEGPAAADRMDPLADFERASRSTSTRSSTTSRAASTTRSRRTRMSSATRSTSRSRAISRAMPGGLRTSTGCSCTSSVQRSCSADSSRRPRTSASTASSAISAPSCALRSRTPTSSTTRPR